MTLILTELTDVGIAMATDSAISKIRDGKIVAVDERGWKKLLRVPRINAAASYWGFVGGITSRQFDIWLADVIDNGEYTSLDSFADHLTSALNSACGGRPLSEGQDAGIHVAGYAEWADGISRPVFYHIHNGHGRYEFDEEYEALEGGRTRFVRLIPEWVAEPRKLFEKHQDFPGSSRSIEESCSVLRSGYLTRNGNYLIFGILAEHMARAFRIINSIPDISIPRDSSNLASRKGFLHVLLEIIVRLYRCSNQSKFIGGKVTSDAIGPDGYVN